jgi:hypothetical protein
MEKTDAQSQAVASGVPALARYEALSALLQAATAADAQRMYAGGEIKSLSAEEYRKAMQARFPEAAARGR